jgi:predicted metal-dependent hydrolase
MASPIVRDARVTVAGRTFAFKLYRVPRRKHVHLMVNHDGVLEVRAPWRFSVDQARMAIHEHGRWVLGALDECRSQLRMRPLLVSGAELPLLDERLRLKVESDAQLSLFGDATQGVGQRASVLRLGRVVKVRVRSLERSSVRPLLEAWYRSESKSLLPLRLSRWAEKLEVGYSRVTIRAQRARWGSCSSTGAINLNWRLVMLPGKLCDYVLVHELCHLREMNHSPAFWREVERAVPDYRKRREQLGEVARTLPL